MQFTIACALAVVSSPTLTFAAAPNPFNVPMNGYTGLTAGESYALTWNPTTAGTVSLVLRSGNAQNLEQGSLIVSNLANSGSYTWTIPSGITRAGDYTVEIVDDAMDSNTNYTPFFSINSTNTIASSTSIYAPGAPTLPLAAVNTATKTVTTTASPQSATSVPAVVILPATVPSTAASLTTAGSVISSGTVPNALASSSTANLATPSDLTKTSAFSSSTLPSTLLPGILQTASSSSTSPPTRSATQSVAVLPATIDGTSTVVVSTGTASGTPSAVQSSAASGTQNAGRALRSGLSGAVGALGVVAWIA